MIESEINPPDIVDVVCMICTLLFHLDYFLCRVYIFLLFVSELAKELVNLYHRDIGTSCRDRHGS
jgi:hypothetical protein